MILFIWLADWLTYILFGLAADSKLGGGVLFFIEDTTKILVLLVLMIYVFRIDPRRIADRAYPDVSDRPQPDRRLHSGGAAWRGDALLLVFEYSTVPRFTAARIAMAFLITSPMVNEGRC